MSRPAKNQILRLHEFITVRKSITSKEVMDYMGISGSTAGTYLNQLAKTGAIQCRGSGLKARWHMIKPAALVTNQTTDPLRQAQSIWHYAHRIASC